MTNKKKNQLKSYKNIKKMHDITDNLLVNLKIISKIVPHSRLKLISSSSTIDTHNMFSWLTRWYNGDSRVKTVQFVKSVIIDSITITNDLMNSTYVSNMLSPEMKGKAKTGYEETEFIKTINVLHLIQEEMTNCKVGLKNLQLTYEADVQIISQLEVQMSKIDAHLGIIKRKLQDIQHGCGDKYAFVFLKINKTPPVPVRAIRDVTCEFDDSD
jgi:hypothetical protein